MSSPPPRSSPRGPIPAAVATKPPSLGSPASAPIPASSGQTHRHRLNRGGDRRLNHALHMIAVTRARGHQETRDYIARRCIKHYLARRLYRLLEHPANGPLTT